MCVTLLPLPLQLGRVVLLVGCLLVGWHTLDALLLEVPLLLGVPLLGALLAGWEIVCERWLVGGRG